MNETRWLPSRPWLTALMIVVSGNYLLLLPGVLAFQSFIAGDLGWAITVDSLWVQGQLPTRDYSYFYGLLTLVVDRGVFAILGREPHSQAALYALCNAAIAFGLARYVAAARLGRTARIFALIAAPIAVMPVAFPSPTHALEPALLINAVAYQAAGRYSAALALVTTCVFVKPSMALVYGAILSGIILMRPNGRTLLPFLPAAVVGGVLAALLAAIFGVGPLVESLLPFAGMKAYADANYGFFFGIGRAFWLVEPFNLGAYFFAPAGFWLLATALLIPASIRAAIYGRGPAAGTTVTCCVMHVIFVCAMFGNHMSWFYYSYILVIGVCSVLDRSGLPLRQSIAGRSERIGRYLLLGLAVSSQFGNVAFGLFVWATAVRTETTSGLFASPRNEETWTEIRTIARQERVFLLAPSGAGHDLMPEVDSVRAWYLIRPTSTPTEIEHVREQIRAAKWIVLPVEFESSLGKWPEFVEEMQSRHFQLVKEYPLFLLFQRAPGG